MRQIVSKLWGKFSEIFAKFPKAISYSHLGEDMILRAFFARYPINYPGFYVDVGAHHPIKFSNTYYFYRLGWQGIAIDPIPGGKTKFRKYRPRDTFIAAGISETGGKMTYYIYASSPLNTFSEGVVRLRPDEVVHTTRVETLTLREVLTSYLPPGQIIDFLSLDVEGYELEVLKSNEWERFRPRVIVVEEMSTKGIEEVPLLEINSFLVSHKYKLIGMIPNSLFYADTTSTVYEETGFLKFE
jgi:FkbM family methyltransferase